MMPAAARYRINLVRSLREKARKEEKQRRDHAMAGAACFVLLALAVTYACLTTLKMERVLAKEKHKLEQVRQEYRKYTVSRTIVDKGDVELLNALQGRGIFWTKKLAALANHLPESYAITGFEYKGGELRVKGRGYASPRQDQLLTLDDYLRRLREDTTFSDVFKELHLNRAERLEDGTRIGFEFTAINPAGRPAQ
ncbi:MAG TPA: hypothetical protein VK465_01935 [Fibrobacteria bacterium]|nr:hypothetical protein [Fibrobacteria bacterium]